MGRQISTKCSCASYQTIQEYARVHVHGNPDARDMHIAQLEELFVPKGVGAQAMATLRLYILGNIECNSLYNYHFSSDEYKQVVVVRAAVL